MKTVAIFFMLLILSFCVGGLCGAAYYRVNYTEYQDTVDTSHHHGDGLRLRKD